MGPAHEGIPGSEVVMASGCWHRSQGGRPQATRGMVAAGPGGWRPRTGSIDRHRQQLRKQLIVLAEDFLRAGGTSLVRLTRSCVVCPFWERRPGHAQNGGNQ